MHIEIEVNMEKNDNRPGLACVTAALVGFGIIMIFSVSSAANTGAMQFGLAVKQSVSVVVGIAALLAVRKIGYHKLIRWRWILFGLAIASLAIVLIPQLGARVNGARRWFRLGPIGIQPSEFAKIALIVFLSGFLARRRELIRDFYDNMSREEHQQFADVLDQSAFILDSNMSQQLARQEAMELSQIEKALKQMRTGAYGICESCNEFIGIGRLKALPFATSCIKCKEVQEQNMRGGPHSEYYGGSNEIAGSVYGNTQSSNNSNDDGNNFKDEDF